VNSSLANQVQAERDRKIESAVFCFFLLPVAQFVLFSGLLDIETMSVNVSREQFPKGVINREG